MAEKKSARRFTIQFCEKNSAHRQAADILNRLEWRGKAQYIADAVLYYESRESAVGSQPMARVDENLIEAVVRRILSGIQEGGEGIMPVDSSVKSGEAIVAPLPLPVSDAGFDDAVEAIGEDGIGAIVGVLGMFRGG